MKKVDVANKIPIKFWLDTEKKDKSDKKDELLLEQEAYEQARHLANLPFAFHHIAIMPDSHVGFGMPIGGVMATPPNIIIPNAVGVK